MLVAGPASRKTSTAPGLAPLSSRAAAIGVEAVAQIYTGMPTTSMVSIDTRPPPSTRLEKSSGR